jgi:hypothetical protein
MYAYAYPPLSLLPLVLHKIQTSCCTVIVIAPRWPRRSRYVHIPDLLVDFPLALPEVPDLLMQDKRYGLSQTSVSGAFGMEAELGALLEKGISGKAAGTILQSIRPGTRETYEAKWRAFVGWCQGRIPILRLKVV